MNRPSIEELKKDYQTAGRLTREIVAVRVPVLAGVGLIGGVLVQQGVIPDGVADSVTHWAGVVFTVVGVVAGVLWARKDTTVADPKRVPMDKDGNFLAPVVVDGPHPGRSDELAPADAQAAFAAAELVRQPT